MRRLSNWLKKDPIPQSPTLIMEMQIEIEDGFLSYSNCVYTPFAVEPVVAFDGTSEVSFTFEEEVATLEENIFFASRQIPFVGSAADKLFPSLNLKYEDHTKVLLHFSDGDIFRDIDVGLFVLNFYVFKY